MALYSVRLECVEGTSDKFYLQCVRAGASRGTFVVETTYGRNGCAGTMMHSDPHRTLDAARGAVDAMVAKKLRKGYVRVSSAGEASGVVDDEDGGAGGGAGGAPPAKKARVAEKPAAKAKADKPFSPMLAGTFNGSQNVSGWLMSEKMDGIRAVFHPESRELCVPPSWISRPVARADRCARHSFCIRRRTRTGKPIFAPPEFIAGFPKDFMLDGELFISYGNFDKVSGIVRSGSNTSMARWAGVRYVVFDAPRVAKPFAGRLAAAQGALAGVAHAAVLAHERCANVAALNAFHERIAAAGGEGVMVRDPGGAYVHSRSNLLLKVKKFIEEEATVTGHEVGKGRLAACTGALTCRFDDGTRVVLLRLRLGRRDAQRAAAGGQRHHRQVL